MNKTLTKQDIQDRIANAEYEFEAKWDRELMKTQHGLEVYASLKEHNLIGDINASKESKHQGYQ